MGNYRIDSEQCATVGVPVLRESLNCRDGINDIE